MRILEISSFTVDSEVIGNHTNVSEPHGDGNPDFCVTTFANAKSPVQSLIRSISREVNHSKITYSQLKYVFRSVRERCDLTVTSSEGRKLYELPTSEELRCFYKIIDDPVHRLIFETLESSGLRISELCNLEVKRIDFETNLVFVSEGKGKKDRTTILGSRLLEKMELYLTARNNRYLFESNRGTKFSARRIQQLCQCYRKLSGIKKRLTAHSFRHKFFTRLAEAGIPKEKRMILAGHSSEAVQDQYTHLGIGGVRIEVLNVLDRLGF